MVWQASPDGTLFEGDDPKHPTDEQKLEILKQSLASMGWDAVVEKNDPPAPRVRFFKFTGQVSKVETDLTLEIYIFPNLAYGNRPSRPHEKRIQLTRPYEEHATDFQLSKTGDHRCLLLGFYMGSEDDPIICAWDSSVYLDHADPSSCYVDIRAVAEAYRIGFARSVDAKNRYVCCFRPEFIHYYLANMDHLHIPDGEAPQVQDEERQDVATGAENRIFYGAPGTGKTHTVDARTKGKNCIRTVFHPDLQNGDFIGGLKPVTRDGSVTYEFSPGPFAQALKEATTHPEDEVFLIIEELNRAPAAAVFGDLFLLLDRDPSGRGKYDADFPNDEFRVWLGNQCEQEINKLRLPSNLSLLATMNSADQGVFPLDTAFRRRWEQEYIKIDYSNAPNGSVGVVMSDDQLAAIPWASFVHVLNDYLTEHLSISEDRLLGPWFVSDVELDACDAVPGKVLIYLWDDLLRHHGREIVFNTAVAKTYGALSFRASQSDRIFSDDFLEALESVRQDDEGNE